MITSKVKWDENYQKRAGVTAGPADGLDQAFRRKIDHTAKRIYRALNLSGYARLDFRLSEQGGLYLLEANPNPNLAYGDYFAESCEHDGVSYEELLHKIITLGRNYDPFSG